MQHICWPGRICAAVLLPIFAISAGAAQPVNKADHWAFKPTTRPAIPEVKQSAWVRNPVDTFILARLEKEGLTPSPEADRRTLIRRVTNDLTGLPPTPLEVDQFLHDSSPDAYERLVDRLLASPRYGERWARHWLDVVHYGDSMGYDKDKPRPNAWPYRDYVIRAFNEDKPYSRFVREQLAGDVLFPGSADALAATGFIAAGPWDFVGQTELREGTVDKLITRSLDRDDMVMTTMSTFQSLTVHCARCHDHKFDPITQQDYYRLQAVFAGVDRADRPLPDDAAAIALKTKLTADRSKLEAEKAEIEKKLAAAVGPEIAQLDAKLSALRPRLATLPAPVGNGPPSLGYHSQIEPTRDTTKWVQVDLGASAPIEQIFLVPSHVAYGGWPGPGFGFPVRFRVDLSDDEHFEHFETVSDQTTSDLANPGDTPFAIVTGGRKGRFVRVTATRLFQRTGDFIFALAELVVFSDGKNIAAGAPVTALDSIEAPPGWGRANLVDGLSVYSSPGGTVAAGGASPSNGYHSGIEPNPNVIKWVQVDLGEAKPLDDVRLFPARPTDFPDTLGFGFPVRFKVECSDDAAFTRAHLLADYTAADYPNPRDKRVILRANGQAARFVRVTATKLWERTNDFVFALAELQVQSGGRNVAAGAAVTSLDSIEQGRWSTRYLVDGYDSRQSLEPRAPSAALDWVAALGSQADRAKYAELEKRRRALAEMTLDEASKASLQSLPSRISELDQELQATRPRAVYAVASLASPRPVNLLSRGDVKQPLQLIKPGTIAVLADGPADFALPKIDDEGARRAALAEWIVNPHNMLTRRSIVNRVWQYHFGRGIVDSPGDFGHMGAMPSHPELLDHLAWWFLDHGESIKSLHRLLLTSAAYRQSSAPADLGMKIDSDNRLLWRMNRTRLDAEQVRDGILADTGKLDLTMGGPAVQQFFFKDDHSPVYDYARFDVDSPGSFRRSIYRFTVRSVPDPFMETLDCPDASLLTPKRNITITALQALSLMNNPFVLRQCGHLAERLERESPNDLPAQIRNAYHLTLARPPTESELNLLVEHARKHGLASACRILLNCNEFLFVD